MSITKLSSPNNFLLGAGLLGGLGSLFGIGDSDHNYRNDFFHKATGSRAAQGALSGLAGVGGYKAFRGLGKGRAISGLAALLSAGGAAALANPTLKVENPYRLPF